MAGQVHALHGRAVGADAGPEFHLHGPSLPAAGGCGLGAEPLPSPHRPCGLGRDAGFPFISGVGGIGVAGCSLCGLAKSDFEFTVVVVRVVVA